MKTPLLSPMILGLLACCLVAHPLAPAAEERLTDAERQTLEKLEARIEAAYDLHRRDPAQTEEAYLATIRTMLSSLRQDEIRLVARHVAFDSEPEAFRVWARFDPAGALAEIRRLEEANAAGIERGQAELEGSRGQLQEEYVLRLYLAAMRGWAEVDARAAWVAFGKRRGALANSRVLGRGVDEFHPVLCETMAKLDPDLVFQSVSDACKSGVDEWSVAARLRGYLQGAPRGRDWRKEAEELLQRNWKICWVHAELRTRLLGRWMQDDAGAAEAWFRATAVEGFSWTRPAEANGAVVRHDVGSAAGYWAAQDPVAAWQWIKAHPGRTSAGFKAGLLHGASVFLGNATFADHAEVPAVLRQHSARFTGTKDRDAWTSMVDDATTP